ncbi:MAG: DnaB-like helicase N-terminal domain-containing protein, partial [Rudaea sp.]
MAASPDRMFSSARVDALRVPPHSIDAEQAVLGGLMLDEHAWERIADKLGEEDFYRKDHRLIFRAIGDLASKNQPCDAVTLGEWFESSGLADEVGGVAYVIQLANATPSAANILAYAGIVREKSVLRQLIEAGTQIVGDGFQPEGRKSEEILAEAEQRVFHIAETGARGKKSYVEMRAAVHEA